jgi:hypothetical protein
MHEHDRRHRMEPWRQILLSTRWMPPTVFEAAMAKLAVVNAFWVLEFLGA